VQWNVTVKMHAHTRMKLGDLVVAAYDEAARHSADPREVSRVANQVVLRLLHARFSRRRDADARSPGGAASRNRMP
jgi:hypothetical protein